MCAREFGLDRFDRGDRPPRGPLASLEALPRHRGHLLNWYDTERAQALLPQYVSTVDSGNLCMHLLAVAQACLELAAAPHDPAAMRRELAESKTRIDALRTASELPPPPATLAALLDDADPLRSWPPTSSIRRSGSTRARRAARLAAGARRPRRRPARATAWSGRRGPLGTHCARRCVTSQATKTRPRAVGAIAATCKSWRRAEPRIRVSLQPQRRLFHIGFRVAEHQLDAGFYDLLASEARATSLWAIAKGDVSAAHWAALGRPLFAVGDLAGLRSWSGSMFEYLMPPLVLDEPHGSVLHSASRAAVEEQIAFGRHHHVPWGISESAYAGSDHTLAYQYAPQACRPGIAPHADRRAV